MITSLDTVTSVLWYVGYSYRCCMVGWVSLQGFYDRLGMGTSVLQQDGVFYGRIVMVTGVLSYVGYMDTVTGGELRPITLYNILKYW